MPYSRWCSPVASRPGRLHRSAASPRPPRLVLMIASLAASTVTVTRFDTPPYPSHGYHPAGLPRHGVSVQLAMDITVVTWEIGDGGKMAAIRSLWRGEVVRNLPRAAFVTTRCQPPPICFHLPWVTTRQSVVEQPFESSRKEHVRAPLVVFRLPPPKLWPYSNPMQRC